MLRAGRYVVGGSHVLDYGRAGPKSRTTSGEVRRRRTTSGQVRVSIINPKSMANFVVELEVEKTWGVLSI